MLRSYLILSLICVSFVCCQDIGTLVNTFLNLDPTLASTILTQYLNTFLGQNLNISSALIEQYVNILSSLNPNTTIALLEQYLSTFLSQNVDVSNVLNNLTSFNLLDVLLVPVNQNLESFYTNVVTPFVNSLSINDPCEHQILLFIQSLNKSEDWTWRMLDAMAKPQAGILFGNIMHIGNYDECLEIFKSTENEEIRGKYCTVPVRPHPKYGTFFNFSVGTTELEKDRFEIESRLSYGLCVPQACNALKLQLLMNFAEDILKLPIHFKFDDDFCNSAAGQPLDKTAIVGLVVFGLFALVVVCSTLYELLYLQKKKGQTQDIYAAFSLISNGKKLFSIKENHDALRCLNGLRVISMMWVMLIHRFQILFFLPNINSIKLTEWRNNISNSILTAGDMSVDTFLFVGGFLVVYTYMKHEDKNIKTSLFRYYFHRLLRLTPSFAMIILLSVTFFQYMGSGPFWIAVVKAIEKPCKNNWWQSLFYLQNYVNPNERCVVQAWYLAVDIQMFFLSPLIIYFLLKWPKRTILLMIVYIIAVAGYVFGISMYKKIGCTVFDQNSDYMTYVYLPTHVRGCIYLCGMICGYYIYTTLKKPLQFSKITIIFLWVTSLGLLLAVVLINGYFVKGVYSDWQPPLFNALSRPIWALGLFGVISLCTFGYGNFINKFLSHHIFTVLIGFNYNIYIVHMHILYLTTGQKKTAQYFSNLTGFHSFWGDYMYSLGLSIVWTLMFDAPFTTLEKLITAPKKKDNTLAITSVDVKS